MHSIPESDLALQGNVPLFTHGRYSLYRVHAAEDAILRTYVGRILYTLITLHHISTDTLARYILQPILLDCVAGKLSLMPAEVISITYKIISDLRHNVRTR